MNKKKAGKYYILIVLFTILFFVCMAFCFSRYQALTRGFGMQSLSRRMEGMKLDEKMFGPEHIYYSLYFNDNYEEDFDEYWEFSDAYLAYRMGRLAEDKTPYIDVVQNYLDSVPGGERERAARGYLEELEAH